MYAVTSEQLRSSGALVVNEFERSSSTDLLKSAVSAYFDNASCDEASLILSLLQPQADVEGILRSYTEARLVP